MYPFRGTEPTVYSERISNDTGVNHEILLCTSGLVSLADVHDPVVASKCSDPKMKSSTSPNYYLNSPKSLASLISTFPSRPIDATLIRSTCGNDFGAEVAGADEGLDEPVASPSPFAGKGTAAVG